MLHTNKKVMAAILAVVLIFCFMLTACNKGGETPNGDNSTPGTVMETPNGEDTTPSTSGNAPAKKDFAWLDPSKYDTAKKAEVDDLIKYYGGDEVDIDKLIPEAFAEYSEFINENITFESVRTAIVASRVPMTYRSNKNLTKLPETSLKKVNDYLKSNGAEPLDSANYKQDIAALAIAASLFYETNWDNAGNALYDITMAFGRAYSGANEPDEYIGVGFMNRYYILLDE